jgi:hypothetical protein
MVVGIAFPMGKAAKLRKPKKSRYSDEPYLEFSLYILEDSHA